MSFLKNLFNGATPGKQAQAAAVPQSLIVTAQLPRGQDRRALALMGLRRGMWIVVDEYKVAILTDFLPDGENEDTQPLVRVRYTDELGCNLNVEAVAPSRCRQAAWKDIPEARRPHEDAAANKGYRV